MCLKLSSRPPQADPPALRLPPELLHSVFELLDKPALSACSLAAHCWLEVAQSHLFKSLVHHITVKDDCGGPQAPPLQDLLEFLDASPWIGVYIRSLSLKMVRPLYSSRYRDGRLNILCSILRRTQGLRVLEIHHLIFSELLSPESIPQPNDGPALGHLDSLRVNFLTLPLEIARGDHIFRLFQLVDTIDELHLESFAFPSLTPDRVRAVWPPHVPKRVRALRLTHSSPVGHLSMISLDRLESLSLDVCTRDTLTWLAAFLTRPAGRRLRRIALPAYEGHAVPVLDLSPCAALERLVLAAAVCTDPRAAGVGVRAQSYAFMCAALASAPRTVRTVAFRLRHTRATAAGVRKDWTELDELFAGRGVRVRVEIDSGKAAGGLDVAAVYTCVAGVLPRTYARGVMRFVDVSGA
ncbi:hypothetical protein PHLGIDRAFT_241474 [Phlebiopsis gigantea 11061_1 CR5-6]|uniref:F-box domain-containing protein n=1 Tax=Phlebiopsis gigantea (strain 11061_1 CR5-6) TaxID=745531 RepID=A0A0C3PSQ1_PHLG1|nr:hypothetical protein PHLGIDRAFT_241474 [Phlebiopsis gigantea 11061_1 CR5-6]